MIPDINRKISELVSHGITTESQAVYLLVQIRKLFEMDARDDCPYLQFHIDWALHTKMDRAPAQRIPSVFNEAHRLLIAGATMRDLAGALGRELDDIFSMNHFRNELAAFLKARSLPHVDCVKDGWTKFLWHYANVIEDCPLQIRSTDATSTIQKVTLKAELANRLQEGEQLYKISWHIADLHGESGELFVLNSISATAS